MWYRFLIFFNPPLWSCGLHQDPVGAVYVINWCSLRALYRFALVVWGQCTTASLARRKCVPLTLPLQNTSQYTFHMHNNCTFYLQWALREMQDTPVLLLSDSYPYLQLSMGLDNPRTWSTCTCPCDCLDCLYTRISMTIRSKLMQRLLQLSGK